MYCHAWATPWTNSNKYLSMCITQTRSIITIPSQKHIIQYVSWLHPKLKILKQVLFQDVLPNYARQARMHARTWWLARTHKPTNRSEYDTIHASWSWNISRRRALLHNSTVVPKGFGSRETQKGNLKFVKIGQFTTRHKKWCIAEVE